MKRALLVALPAVLAIGLVACGDDDSTSNTATATNTTTPSANEATAGSSSQDTLPGGITVPDLGSILPGGSLPDLGSILPGGSLPDLGSILPNISVPSSVSSEDIQKALQRVFPKLTDQQVKCLSDGLGGKLDFSKVSSLFKDCDISAQDLIPGG
jgi:hypothetical protein